MTDSAPAAGSSKRFRELDGLRGIAALAVVVYHLVDGVDVAYPELPQAGFSLGWGKYGVQLFFMISGFVILMSAGRASRVRDFAISRFSRLYPPYWIALAMSTLLLFTFGVPIAGGQIGPAQVAINATMIQRWVLQPNVDQVYWTLGVEMQFYVIMAVLLFLTRCHITPKLVGWWTAAWTGIVVIVAVLALQLSGDAGPDARPTLVKILLNAFVVPYGALFSAGMLAYLGRTLNRKWFAGAWACGLIAAGVYALLDSPRTGLIVVVIVVIFMIVAMREQTRVLTVRPVQWLGKLSYSLYIGHLAVGFTIIQLLGPTIGRWPASAVALVAVFAWSMTIHELGEERGSRRLRAWLKSLSPEQPQPRRAKRD